MSTRPKPKSGSIVMWIFVRTFFAAVVILLLAPLASGWLAWFSWFVFGWLVIDLSLVLIGRQFNKIADEKP